MDDAEKRAQEMVAQIGVCLRAGDKAAAINIATAALRAAEARGIERAADDVKAYGAVLEQRETDPLARRTVEGCARAFEHRIRALAEQPAPQRDDAAAEHKREDKK